MRAHAKSYLAGLVATVVAIALAALVMSTTATAKPVYGPGCVVRGYAPVNVPHSTIDGRAWAYCHRRPAPRIDMIYTIESFDDETSATPHPVTREVTHTFRNKTTTSKDVMISYRCKPGKWSWYELWVVARVFDPPRVVVNIYWHSLRVHLKCPNPSKKSSNLL